MTFGNWLWPSRRRQHFFGGLSELEDHRPRGLAPLTAGLLSPIKADAKLECQRRTQLDRLYQRVIDDLDTLVRAVGLKAA